MDGLRLWLVLAGLAIIVGIYLWGRMRPSQGKVGRRRRQEESFDVDAESSLGPVKPEDEWEIIPLPKREPSASHPPAREAVTPPAPPPQPAEPEPKPAPVEPAPKRPERAKEWYAVFNVVSHPGLPFAGPRVLEAFHQVGLVHGAMKIFHMPDPAHPGESLFSVANMVEPGFFDLEGMEGFETPGVTLFMRVPEGKDSLAAFDKMLVTARRLAQIMAGDLRDERRGALTVKAINDLRERVIASGPRQR